MHMNTMPLWYWYILFFLVGSRMGSFVSLCIERIPNKISVFYPPSYCPLCGRRVYWYDNLPIISYILLKGKCRHCNFKIPMWYFANEIGMGLCYAVIFILVHGLYPLWIYIMLCMMLSTLWVWVGIMLKTHKLKAISIRRE